MDLAEENSCELQGHCCIPDEATDFFFNLPNHSDRAMAPGLTWPVIEMSSRNHAGHKCGRSIGLTITPPSLSRLP
jgi:hypothetical protein